MSLKAVIAPVHPFVFSSQDQRGIRRSVNFMVASSDEFCPLEQWAVVSSFPNKRGLWEVTQADYSRTYFEVLSEHSTLQDALSLADMINDAIFKRLVDSFDTIELPNGVQVCDIYVTPLDFGFYPWERQCLVLFRGRSVRATWTPKSSADQWINTGAIKRALEEHFSNIKEVV
jgi:hypothetical protein